MDFLFLSQTALFRGCSPRETADMLQCLRAERRVYEKDRVICHAGDTVEALGLVLSGGVNIESVDVWGSRSILGHVGPGQVFAETYACLPGEPLMVDAVAAQRTEVLFLNTARLLRTCPSACAHHAALIRNLLAVTSQKNLALSRRIFHTSPKTIRGRLLSYLSAQALRENSRSFAIPFDRRQKHSRAFAVPSSRQQLADYLGVDRSALSAELGRMRAEGLIRFRKNEFELLREP